MTAGGVLQVGCIPFLQPTCAVTGGGEGFTNTSNTAWSAERKLKRPPGNKAPRLTSFAWKEFSMNV